jgi:hypothetical protein
MQQVFECVAVKFYFHSILKLWQNLTKKLEKVVEFLFCGKFLHSGDKKIHVIHFKVFKAKHGHKLPYFEEKVRI